MDGLGRDIWFAVTEEFERLRGRQARELWLTGARPRSFHRGLFTLDVADPTAKAAIDGRYRGDLESIFQDITGSPVRLRTRVSDEPTGEVPDGRPAPGPRLEPPRVPRAPRGVGIPGSSAFRATRASEIAHAAVGKFVAGDDDGFSHLFVHGPPGCGKTALARHALARLAESLPDCDPLVLSGDALARDVMRAARTRTFGSFQRGWGGRDVVVIDEAHRLRGQKVAQSMIVTLIGPLVQRGGRVLVLSRHAPRAMHGIGERLLSHFVGGMVVAMRDPDPGDREAVLEEVSAAQGASAEPGVLAAVATRCPGTLHDAVELLGRAAATARAEGRAVLMSDVEMRLSGPSSGEVNLDALVRLLARETGIEAERIRSAEKSRDVAAVRHLCVFLATRSLGLSSRQVCRSLRLRSPSIVAYARRAVERKRNLDAEYERLIQTVQGRLAGAQRDLPW